MKKAILRILSLALCIMLVFTLGACGDKDTESGAGLLDFGDETGDGLTKDDGTASNGASSAQGSNSSGGSSNGDGGSSSSSGDGYFDNIPARLKGTTVTFACWGDEGNSAYQPMIRAFTKKTGIKVKIENVEQGTYMSTVQQKIVAGKGPDVIVDCEAFATAISILQPIEKYIDLSDDFWDDDCTKITTVNGHTYEVNSKKSNWKDYNYLIYNKSLFTKNSIKSPGDYWKEGKWTYENALKCMRDMAKTGNYGGDITSYTMAASLGTPMVSYDPATQTFKNNITNENVVKAWQFHRTLMDENIWEQGMWFTHFNNGSVGLYTGGVFNSKFNGRFSSMDGSLLAAVPMPVSYEGKELKQVATHRGYGIAKNAANPEGAAYFLRWFLDYQNYKDAGVKVFKNSEIENWYFKEYIPYVEKVGVTYDFYQCALKILKEDANQYIEIKTEGKEQIPALLASKVNEVDSAIKELNSLLK